MSDFDKDIINKYVKENNIIGYLNYGLDFENFIKYLDKEKIGKILKDYRNEEEYFITLMENYNFELAFENKDIESLVDYIYGCEFDIDINKDGTLDLIDRQGAYLGDWESYQGFLTIEDIMYRLGIYLYDYYGIGEF